MTWAIVKTKQLTQELIKSLFANEVGAVWMPGFIPANICQLAVNGILAHGFEIYTDKKPPVKKLGITQNEHKYSAKQKAAYFSKVSVATQIRQEVFGQSGDLLVTVIDAIRRAWPELVIPAEDEGNQYFAGVLRIMTRGYIHYDWTHLDAEGWSIEEIVAQLTWNVYLQMGEEGGATKIYRKYYVPEDEPYRGKIGSYGFGPAVIERCESIEFRPQVGDLVMFNPRNYHEILQTHGKIDRISFSTFMGQLDDNSIIYWS